MNGLNYAVSGTRKPGVLVNPGVNPGGVKPGWRKPGTDGTFPRFPEFSPAAQLLCNAETFRLSPVYETADSSGVCFTGRAKPTVVTPSATLTSTSVASP